MKLIDNILLATDFLDHSDNVIDNAVKLANTFHAEINLLLVLPPNIEDSKAKDMLRQAANEKLRQAAHRMSDAGVRSVKPLLKFGVNHELIVQVAESIDANIILIGAGGKLEDDRWGLGITAEKVIQKSNKPVLVVNREQPLTAKRILCPVDFSAESTRALKNAIIFARRFESRLSILTVFEAPHSELLTRSKAWDQQMHKQEMDYRKQFDKYLEDFNLKDVQWDKQVVTGKPAREILKTIEKQGVDLLIIGTTGRTGLSKWLMGSVTEKVIRALPCTFITTKSEDVIKLQLERNIKDIESHTNIAKQLMKDGYYHEAINEYKIILHINDMHVPAFHGIAEAYEKLNMPKEAQEYRDLAGEVLKRIWNLKIEQDIRRSYL